MGSNFDDFLWIDLHLRKVFFQSQNKHDSCVLKNHKKCFPFRILFKYFYLNITTDYINE